MHSLSKCFTFHNYLLFLEPFLELFFPPLQAIINSPYYF
nr:MAG TPA: hypothetical protein [Caudoviricetes sp.]DAL78832.1 MAG TPA: hypothetical protein [Caudoviricetes sp.]DAX04665.1 MAG TPA: hypothetical protein [Bacteriophage sp.]